MCQEFFVTEKYLSYKMVAKTRQALQLANCDTGEKTGGTAGDDRTEDAVILITRKDIIRND